MSINIKLSQLKTFHYTFTKIIQTLLNPIKMIEFEDIFIQLESATIIEFKIDNYILSIKILFDQDKANCLNIIGREFCKSNLFQCIIDVDKVKDTNKKILSIDFLNHNLDFLIEAYSMHTYEEEVSKEAIKSLKNLFFIIPKENMEKMVDSDIEKLIYWANVHKLSKDEFPRSKKELLSLEILCITDKPLYTIPKNIRILKKLKYFSIEKCQLIQVPLELFTLTNLETLRLQHNNLSKISNSINNLINLKELFINDNNLQKLPSLDNLTQLNKIVLNDNYLSISSIEKCLPKHIHCKLYYKKYSPNDIMKKMLYLYACNQISLPFNIEPLSYNTLYEAEALRDKIFKKDIKNIEKELLRASLNKEKYQKIYKNNNISTLQYWVTKDLTSKKIIGLTGIYTEIDDYDNCWLGWFCIDEYSRKNGFGKKLLEFSIRMATKTKKKNLCIYTYDIKKYKNAILLYKKYGFVQYTPNSNDKKELLFEKKL